MGKKRKNRGYNKGNKGRGGTVQCAGCGAFVPRAKAKKVFKKKSFVDYTLAKELRKQGAWITEHQDIVYYCISCAVRLGRYAPRAREDRRKSYQNQRY